MLLVSPIALFAGEEAEWEERAKWYQQRQWMRPEVVALLLEDEPRVSEEEQGVHSVAQPEGDRRFEKLMEMIAPRLEEKGHGRMDS